MAVAPASTITPAVHRGIVVVIAACCGVTVMNIYLAFPMITLFAESFGVPDAQAATVATISQVGYAIGLFFLIPLGDVVRRKRLLTVLITGATLGLVVASLAPNIQTLSVATFVLSGLTVAPHVLIPLIITIVPSGYRGRALATVNVAMTTGIAVSRVGGAWLGEFAGWQWVYVAAAALTCGVGVLTILLLPRETARPGMKYGRLLLSTLALLKTEPRVRWSIALQMPVFATFNLIWAMMILLLTGPPYSLTVGVAGLFGLLGLAPLVTARLMGRLIDSRGPHAVIGISLITLVVATIVLQFSLLSLVVVIVGIVLLTIGQQGAGLGNQTRTLTLRDDSRSRLNTLYMTSNFLGGSAASGIAVLVYASYGWHGITVTALATATLALAVFCVDMLRQRRALASVDGRPRAS
jgi:predicted MFS family arabinose efflux permease